MSVPPAIMATAANVPPFPGRYAAGEREWGAVEVGPTSSFSPPLLSPTPLKLWHSTETSLPIPARSPVAIVGVSHEQHCQDGVGAPAVSNLTESNERVVPA